MITDEYVSDDDQAEEMDGVEVMGVECASCLVVSEAMVAGRFVAPPPGWLASADGELVCGLDCAALLEQGDDAAPVEVPHEELSMDELEALTRPAPPSDPTASPAAEGEPDDEGFAAELAAALGEPGPRETLAALDHEQATERGEDAAEE